MKLRIRRERVYFAITWLRVVLAWVIAAALLLNRRTAIFLFIFTALVGFLETFIAKKYPSALRSIVDFFADKILVNFTAIILWVKGVLPIWVVLIILARDLLTIIIGTILLYRDLRREFKPTVIGKIGYFLQIMALIPVMLTSQVDWILMSSALALTVISGVYALIKSEFRLVRKRTELDDFRMLKLMKFADMFTLLNAALGLVSIIFSIGNYFDYAAYALLVALVSDYLDGKIAASMHQQTAFGKELDSLADTVSFGVAPAIFGFSLMQFFMPHARQFQLTFGIIAFTIFLFCGVLRLARYNIMDMKGFYRGMPITLNGILIPLVYFIGSKFYPVDYVRFFPYIYLLLGILMVSSLRIKKFG